MWQELGISGGAAIVILIALYFIIKWAVKNGINQSALITTEQLEQYRKTEAREHSQAKEVIKKRK